MIDENDKQTEMVRRWNDGRTASSVVPYVDYLCQMLVPKLISLPAQDVTGVQSLGILKMQTLFTQAKQKQPGKSVLCKSHRHLKAK